MLSFFNEPQLKQGLLNRLQQHYDADEFINGKYWDGGKGCFVGCAVHGSSYERFQSLYGLPLAVPYLGEALFESLYVVDPSSAKEFPLEFVEAIPVGVDLSTLNALFQWWILMDSAHGLLSVTEDCSQLQCIITSIGELWKREMKGFPRTIETSDKICSRLTLGFYYFESKYRHALNALELSHDAYMVPFVNKYKPHVWEEREHVRLSEAIYLAAKFMSQYYDHYLFLQRDALLTCLRGFGREQDETTQSFTESSLIEESIPSLDIKG